MTEQALKDVRVLDLTQCIAGPFATRLLAGNGADVIKIERPGGGDPARKLAPFYHDEVSLEKSGLFLYLNTGKRGVTLNLKHPLGVDIFKELVKTSDIVIESFSPGVMSRLGLDYETLEEINPKIVVTSISNFGQTGPYRLYKAPDIVAWAMSGFMYSIGDPDRPPVQVSHFSQAYLHAGAQAALGAMLALYHRNRYGQGQLVDISIHESVARLNIIGSSLWDVLKVRQMRGERAAPTLQLPWTWPCKDGYVIFVYFIGSFAERISLPLIRWMEDEGMGNRWLSELDWETINPEWQPQDMLDGIIKLTQDFFLSHTTAELYEGALERNVMLYPVSSVKDIMDNIQLSARGYWTELDYPELGVKITHPGAFAHISESPPRIYRRAPLIGEHNDDVYEKELNISPEDINRLREAGVI